MALACHQARPTQKNLNTEIVKNGLSPYVFSKYVQTCVMCLEEKLPFPFKRTLTTKMTPTKWGLVSQQAYTYAACTYGVSGSNLDFQLLLCTFQKLSCHYSLFTDVFITASSS